jgi:hypothetical protein
MTSGASATSSAAYFARIVNITSAPAVLDLDVVPDSPAQLLQSLQESGIADLHLRIVCSVGHERANARIFSRCCARAANGHAAAAPPSSDMNARRFTARCLPCFRQKG